MLNISSIEDVIFESLIEHLDLKDIELESYELYSDSKTYYLEYNVCLSEYISYESTQYFEIEITNNLISIIDIDQDYKIDLKLRWIVKH
jgi:hypothetical protein